MSPEELLAASQQMQPDGCCSRPGWRGNLCGYHQGFVDGIEAALSERSEESEG